MCAQTIKISHADWMEATHLKLKPRSSALKKVDQEIAKYEAAIRNYHSNATQYQISDMLKGNTDGIKYAENWHLREIKIALDQWKSLKGQWKNNERNKTGAISNLDNLLRHAATTSPLVSKVPDEQFAANARKGILYFLSKSRTRGMPQDPVSLLADASFAGADAHHLYSMAKDPEFPPAKLARDLGSEFGRSELSATGASNRVNNIGVLNELYNELVRFAREWIDGESLTTLIDSLPRIIGEIFSGVMSQVGAIKKTADAIKKAFRAYATYRHRDELEAGILSGHPRQIISSVHEQIRDDIKDAAIEAFRETLTAGLDVAAVGVATVVKAIVSVFKFVKKLCVRFRETRKLRKTFEEARTKRGIWTDSDEFQKWFKDVIKDLPIVSCYCMCMPMTGSYYGFLAAASTNSTTFSYSQLERNNALFNDVKFKARKFIADHGIKIESSDPMVAMSLKVAQGKSLNIGDFENKKSSMEGLKRYMGNVGKPLADSYIEATAKNTRYGWW